MDKLKIATPIKQHVFGTRGAYRCLLEEQKEMTVKQFREIANSSQHAPSKKYSEDDELMERAFWRSITSNPALYGADNPLSLFDEKLPYGWNLRNLGDLLKTKDVPNIPGVTSPMTYFGMWKSFFSWHLEDVDLLSINYLHFGASKVWYCLAPSEAKRFEAVAATLFPDLRRHCSSFMRHKDIMFSPTMLKTHNIKYVQCKQEPGEFVVLNAGAYHAGYNQGFNCAEAVNFALEDWIPIGARATRCNCTSLKDGVRIEMSIFGWRDSSSESDSDEDEDSSSGEDDSDEDEESSDGEEEEENSDQSSASCSCPATGGANAARKVVVVTKPRSKAKQAAGTKVAGRKRPAAVKQGTKTAAVSGQRRKSQGDDVTGRQAKRQKTVSAVAKSVKSTTKKQAGHPVKAPPQRPRSAPAAKQAAAPVIVMLGNGSMVVKRGQGRPGGDVLVGTSVSPVLKHPTGLRTPTRPRSAPAHAAARASQQAAPPQPALPPERSAVVKRALAEAKALAEAQAEEGVKGPTDGSAPASCDQKDSREPHTHGRSTRANPLVDVSRPTMLPPYASKDWAGRGGRKRKPGGEVAPPDKDNTAAQLSTGGEDAPVQDDSGKDPLGLVGGQGVVSASEVVPSDSEHAEHEVCEMPVPRRRRMQPPAVAAVAVAGGASDSCRSSGAEEAQEDWVAVGGRSASPCAEGPGHQNSWQPGGTPAMLPVGENTTVPAASSDQPLTQPVDVAKTGTPRRPRSRSNGREGRSAQGDQQQGKGENHEDGEKVNGREAGEQAAIQGNDREAGQVDAKQDNEGATHHAVPDKGKSIRSRGSRSRPQRSRRAAAPSTAFLEEGPCPLHSKLAANQTEVSDSEVIDKPFALVMKDGDKPFFCIMQKVRRRARATGLVVLRQLKECMDGLYRPGDLTWEEREDRLKPIRMQFLPEQARREGGYKLLTSRTSIFASVDEKQL